jgi:hypothetical protein
MGAPPIGTNALFNIRGEEMHSGRVFRACLGEETLCIGFGKALIKGDNLSPYQGEVRLTQEAT